MKTSENINLHVGKNADYPNDNRPDEKKNEQKYGFFKENHIFLSNYIIYIMYNNKREYNINA